jgi:quercetin dioxygenase-like cupin family protein
MEDAMKPIVRMLMPVALAALFVLLWDARPDRDVVQAQAPKPIKVTRIYTGADGQSRAEEIELKATNGVSAMIDATGVQFSSRPAAPASDWHTGPQRQFVITLSGRAELEVGDGRKVAVGPGQINLIEDTTGKGHITRNVEDRIVVTIPLKDQNVNAAVR